MVLKPLVSATVFLQILKNNGVSNIIFEKVATPMVLATFTKAETTTKTTETKTTTKEELIKGLGAPPPYAISFLTFGDKKYKVFKIVNLKYLKVVVFKVF